MSEPQITESKASFKCLKLVGDNIEILSLTELLGTFKQGFHAFYTHETLISGIDQETAGSSMELRDIFGKNIKPSLLNDSMTPDELLNTSKKATPHNILILINSLGATKAEFIQTFFQALRKLLSANKQGQLKVGYSLNLAVSWDVFLEREAYSGIIPNAHDYHEYLLWDDAGLAAQSSLSNWDAWRGAGWSSSGISKLEGKPINLLLEQSNIWMSSACQSLTQSLLNLTAFYKGTEQQAYNFEPQNNFVRSLCEFLPRHKSPRSGRYIPSNSLGKKGGPMRWRGLLDDDLHLRKRHLLMDGWLSLWAYEEYGETILYIQPASLALLFWAARTASKPYTDTPNDFLKNYDWSDPHWFSNKWKYNEKGLNDE